jgi:hypothetical protein
VTPEVIVATRVAAIGAVTAIVGQRVYMLKLPQRPTLPAVRVQRIDDVRDQHLRGPVNVNVARVQVDVFVADAGSDAYDTASDLMDAIKGDGLGPNASGLWGWIGSFGSPDDVRVLNAELAGDSVDYEGDELRLLRMRQDFLLHWRAT